MAKTIRINATRNLARCIQTFVDFDPNSCRGCDMQNCCITLHPELVDVYNQNMSYELIVAHPDIFTDLKFYNNKTGEKLDITLGDLE